MLWLIITILFYFILAIVFLVDKYLLTSSIANPGVYTFFVGSLGILVLFLIPFVNFSLPEISQLILAFLAGAVYIFSLFWFYKALFLFEVSRIVPAISALVPLFTFLLVYISSFGKEILSPKELISFLFLILGTFLIMAKKEKLIPKSAFKISIFCAFLFSFSFLLLKNVYLNQPFWSGFILTKIGGFLAAINFLFLKKLRENLLKTKKDFSKKTALIFLSNQAAGAGANILQNWAIALAPIIYVPLINALQGIQYVFLLIFAVFLSLKFPQILKEEISKEILFQKIIAILLIGLGLVIFLL